MGSLVLSNGDEVTDRYVSLWKKGYPINRNTFDLTSLHVTKLPSRVDHQGIANVIGGVTGVLCEV